MSRFLRPLLRSRDKFQEDPSSIGNAVRVLMAVVVAAVFVGSAVIWLFDKRDFPDYGSALWFSLQTVTTVGYGDLTPTTLLGRVVAGLVMIFGIGFVTVITAAITSLFVESARRKREADDRDAEPTTNANLAAQIEEIGRRLQRIERHLGVEDVPADDQPG
jgi:voltage-gated potassium channel